MLAGPVAYSLNTAATPHTGSIVTAGPAVAGGMGGMGGFGGGRTGGTGGFRGGGGMGGLLNATTPGAEVVAALEAGSSQYTWVAAAVGSNNASGYQLATQLPVMAIGGFNGSDPAPSLAQFQQYVQEGKIHYFIGGAGLGGRSNGGSSVSAEIAAWVAANYTAQTIGNTTLYDLSA